MYLSSQLQSYHVAVRVNPDAIYSDREEVAFVSIFALCSFLFTILTKHCDISAAKQLMLQARLCN